MSYRDVAARSMCRTEVQSSDPVLHGDTGQQGEKEVCFPNLRFRCCAAGRQQILNGFKFQC